jgi:hypothetical protein
MSSTALLVWVHLAHKAEEAKRNRRRLLVLLLCVWLRVRNRSEIEVARSVDRPLGPFAHFNFDTVDNATSLEMFRLIPAFYCSCGSMLALLSPQTLTIIGFEALIFAS